jgi:hypothetical protein
MKYSMLAGSASHKDISLHAKPAISDKKYTSNYFLLSMMG